VTSRVMWRGVTLDTRTRDMMDEVAFITGSVYVRPTQGSWSNASASAGTHSGGGAIDIAAAHLKMADRDMIVSCMRRVGFAAWLRTPQQASWPWHIHAIAVQEGGRSDRGVLSASAFAQVKDYYAGRNGLASGKPDDGPRAYVGTTWERYEERTMGWYEYSGKPSGTLVLKPDVYTKLDARIPAAPRNAPEDRMVYLNVAPEWELPDSDPMYWFQTAVLRVRWSRTLPDGTIDNTAYHTHVLTPWESTLITHVHWEMGQRGVGGFWSLRLRGSVTSARITTRYAKGRQD
jgi:hypothetical protein